MLASSVGVGVGVGTALAGSAPKCFGAAARDRERPCINATRSVTPSLRDRDIDPFSACRPVGSDREPAVCTFGARSRARSAVALIGDSHALHWRAALETAARAKRWRGYSVTQPGCHLTRAPLYLPDDGMRAACVRWNRSVVRWLRDHREVRTVFVSQAVITPVVTTPDKTSREVKIDGFRRAWRGLPRTVKRVVVIRDVPITTISTFGCIGEVLAAGTLRPGEVCAVGRAFAVRWDAAVSAAVHLSAKRYRHIDLTEFFCDASRFCYPVVGGVLVHRDVDHMTRTFSRTLGPYLLRRLNRL